MYTSDTHCSYYSAFSGPFGGVETCNGEWQHDMNALSTVENAKAGATTASCISYYIFFTLVKMIPFFKFLAFPLGMPKCASKQLDVNDLKCTFLKTLMKKRKKLNHSLF